MTLADAFLHLLTLNGFLIMVAGVVLGISVGVLPGITAGMLMALTLPFTYHMSSVHAVSLLIAMFVGGVSGGLITATLMRIPGEPNAIMTCLDGYQLARRGAPGRALGLGNASSLVGGALSWIALVLLAPPLAAIAVSFGPFENFAVIVHGADPDLVAVRRVVPQGPLGRTARHAGVLSGHRRELGHDAADLRVHRARGRLQQPAGDPRHVRGEPGGDGRARHRGAMRARIKATMRGMFMSLRDYVVHGWNMIRSSLIGIWIGILPGVGATVASIVAYTTAKNFSRKPEEFGTGSEEAIVAAESANNATTGGTLIPILTLGISGGLTDSILLGALVIHNLQPGPLLYKNNPEIVNTIFATHLVAHLAMFALMTFGIALFARLVQVPRAFRAADGDRLLGARRVRAEQSRRSTSG